MIPKKIHYCWFGGKPLSELAKKCIDSWKKYNPTYEIIEWNESNFNIEECRYMKEAYSVGKWGFVPDYARNKIIYDNGGFYFDTDVEILKPLDSLLNERAIFGFESEKFVNGGNIVAAEKHNPIVKEMYEMYSELSFIIDSNTLNLVASPVYNTQVLVKHGLIQNNTLQELDFAKIFPTEYFCPKDTVTGIMTLTNNTYTIHHYDASWLEDWEKKVKLWKADYFSKKGDSFVTRKYVLIYHSFAAIKNLGLVKGMKYIYRKIKKD